MKYRLDVELDTAAVTVLLEYANVSLFYRRSGALKNRYFVGYCIFQSFQSVYKISNKINERPDAEQRPGFSRDEGRVLSEVRDLCSMSNGN